MSFSMCNVTNFYIQLFFSIYFFFPICNVTNLNYFFSHNLLHFFFSICKVTVMNYCNPDVFKLISFYTGVVDIFENLIIFDFDFQFCINLDIWTFISYQWFITYLLLHEPPYHLSLFICQFIFHVIVPVQAVHTREIFIQRYFRFILIDMSYIAKYSISP